MNFIIQIPFPHEKILVGAVSPSAVWYTGYIFVRSGTVTLQYGSLRDSHYIGSNWSSISFTYNNNTSADSYILDYHATSVRPSFNPGTRWTGFPVRCLVYWLEKRKTLYFVRSGGQDLSVGTLRNAGINNVQWSNISSHYTNLNQSRSYSCAIVELQTMPSNTNERQVGFPVRCLV